MAINHRRGKIGDFDPNKMTTAEWAFPDDGTARYCVAPGNVKTVVTKEELQEILTSSPEAYQALLQLINNLEDNPSELTNILNSIADLQANKINKTDIIQTDTISNPTKVPSSVVTEALGKEIDTINNKLADKTDKTYTGTITADHKNTLVENWGLMPYGASIATLAQGTVAHAFIGKTNETHGSALIIHNTSGNPAFGILGGGEWAWFNITVS